MEKCENRRVQKNKKECVKVFAVASYYTDASTFLIFFLPIEKRISRRQCLQSHTVIYAAAKKKNQSIFFCFSFAFAFTFLPYLGNSLANRTHLGCCCRSFEFAFAFAIIEFHLAIICGCFSSMSL